MDGDGRSALTLTKRTCLRPSGYVSQRKVFILRFASHKTFLCSEVEVEVEELSVQVILGPKTRARPQD